MPQIIKNNSFPSVDVSVWSDGQHGEITRHVELQSWCLRKIWRSNTLLTNLNEQNIIFERSFLYDIVKRTGNGCLKMRKTWYKPMFYEKRLLKYIPLFNIFNITSTSDTLCIRSPDWKLILVYTFFYDVYLQHNIYYCYHVLLNKNMFA